MEQEVNNTWDKIDIDTYRSRNIRRLIGFLQLKIDHSVHIADRREDDRVLVPFHSFDGNKSFRKKTVIAVVSKLRERVLPKPRTNTRPKIEHPLVFLIEWDKQMCRGLPLLEILRETEGLPNFVREALRSRLIIAKKLRPTLGLKVWNHKQAARDYQTYRVPNHRCSCRRLFHEKYRPGGGCVMSMDTNIVTNNKLRDLFNEGGSFRENVRMDYWGTFSTALTDFVSQLRRKFAMLPEEIEEWEQAVEDKVKSQIPQHGGKRSILEEEEVKKDLQGLRSRLVICPTDKAPKNFTFVCKHYYKHMIQEELHQEGGAYVTTALSRKEIYERYELELRESKCPEKIYDEVVKAINQEKFSLPLLYWLPKMHKKPLPKARFIAASYKVMTTKLAIFLNRVLKLITKELKGKDLSHIKREGYRRCFFVDGYEDVVDWLRAYIRPPEQERRNIATYDFSTMYTAIDLNDLVDKVGIAIREAFEGHLGLWAIEAGVLTDCKWIDEDLDPAEPFTYSADQVIDLVRILVNSTYIANGEYIKRQCRGMPMGTNPAPPLANLYCYGCEAPAMDRLYNDVSREIARSFMGTNRLIDDTLATDNIFYERNVIIADDPHIPIHPIYNPNLTLNRSDADFLGMMVEDGPISAFYMRVSHKQTKLPFPLINYPSIRDNSNFPKTLAYGVFTGMLHRFHNICTSALDFVAESVGMCRKLAPKGYKQQRLSRIFQGFVRHHNRYSTRASTLIDHFHIQMNQ